VKILKGVEERSKKYLIEDRRVINKSEICIIGAGIHGVCSGYFLAKKGYKVIIIDKGYIAQRASGVNPGTLSVQNKHPGPLLLLAKKSIDVWDYFGNMDKEIGYRRCGGFRIAETEDEAEKLKKDMKKQRKLGLKIEYLEGRDLVKAAPYLSNKLFAANYCGLDGYAGADIAVKRIAKLAQREGVEFILREEVCGVKVKPNTVVIQTRGGVYEAEKLLIACGAWSPIICSWLGVNIPINIDINHVMVSAPERIVIKHVITHTRGILTVKQPDIGTVLIGGGWQGEGNLSTDKKLLSISSIVGNIHCAYRAIPSISNYLINRIWVEFNGNSKDKVPILGKLPGYENIYINANTSGGFTLGPYLGQLAAELIVDGKTSENISYLNPNRFIDSKKCY